MPDPPYELADSDNRKRQKRVFSADEVNELVNTRSREAAREAALDALRERDKERENQIKSQNDGSGEGSGGEGDNLIGLDPKLVKQLQNTVGVFNALKEFASSPIQRVIETEVGTMSADVIRQAFRRPQPEGKRDLIDIVLNSQFAYGLGNGLGQRGPEMVETMDRTFGKKKTEQYLDNILGVGGGIGGGGGSSSGSEERRLGPGSGTGTRNYTPPGPDAVAKERSRRDSERQIILNLDANNPEHVAAYADSQGGMSIDVARRVLLIQQDDFIKQLELENTAIKKELNRDDGTGVDVIRHPPVQQPAHDNNEELVNPISYKSKKETQKGNKKEAAAELEEDLPVDIPDRWEGGDEGILSKERREYERAVMLEKDKARHVHDSSAELVKTEMENRKKLNEQAVAVPEQIAPEPVPEPSEIAPAPEPLNENPNIELVVEEDVIKETEVKKNETKQDVKMCPKCKKIKPLFETEKGPMCQECKTKRGL